MGVEDRKGMFSHPSRNPERSRLIFSLNGSTMLILTDLPPHPSGPIAAVYGPPAPVIKGMAPRSAIFSLSQASKVALREMPGAIVVVEDDAPVFLTKLPPSMSLLRGHLRLFSGTQQPPFSVTPPMPVWMDPSVTTAGGNVVNRIFGFGGGNY
jgi:hypothetical protein